MFNTPSGRTIKRELLISLLNVGSFATPIWSAFGKRVNDSSIEYDWQEDTSTDILGRTYTDMKEPQVTQSFDPYALDAGDTALAKIWDFAVKKHDHTALANMDVLIVHCYEGVANSAVFAERYTACAIRPTGLGGEGGGNLSMPIDVTYGGERITGTAAISAGVVTFTPDSAGDLPTLSAFSITNASFTPTFASTVNSYAATASASTGTVTATPTTAGSSIVILVNGSSIASGGTATWAEGENLVRVEVTYNGLTNVYEAHVTYEAG